MTTGVARASVAEPESGRLPRRRTVKRGSLRRQERRTAIAMVSPAVALIVAVAFLPVLYTIYLSFHDATVSSTGGFVGLANYADAFADPVFREALVNTTIFTVVSVTLELALGLAIALAINRRFRARGLVRTSVLLPWAFPVVVSALMWRLMLQDQVGIVTYLVQQSGLTDNPILSDRESLMVAAIGVDVWKTTPFMALLLVAGLQTIPRDVTEAALVDGASAIQRLTRITLPLLKPAILVALLFRTLEAWSVYDLFWVMSDRQLGSLSTYVFEGVRVSQLQFSTGTAAAVFVFLTSIAIALVFIKGFGARSMEAG
jgi:trehalose/maltose transport system permease protein